MMRFLLLGAALLAVSPAPALEFADGDHVVLIGSTLIEREQRYGYWEAALTVRHPDRTITFRNLGWSGDTVWGEARAGFGTVADGYKHLIDHVRNEKPTVILIGYGTNESFAGPAGLPKFKQQLTQLLDDLATTKARFVLLSPTRQIQMPPPLPDPSRANENLALYAAAIQDEAGRRGAAFIDLLGLLDKAEPSWSENGVHLTAEGYQRTADDFAALLNQPPAPTVPADRFEQLRQTIRAKNELYFHRWRPQNVTYLFGFRKHEQGNNAVEIPQFDPLVAAKEKEIARLRK